MHKLGVIVPFRDRASHLGKFLPHIEESLLEQDIDYRIIVVEQDNAQAFNRGKLCNIGFIEAVRRGCDYVVFHDVDMLPIKVDYSYSTHVIHLASDNLPFRSYFGGITLFPVKIFKEINGFPNNYPGWGFEDDNLRLRCIRNNIKFDKVLDKLNIPYEKLPLLNGTNAYIDIPTSLNTFRDFTISISLELDNQVMDETKNMDVYPIISIPGYEFLLGFNSFNCIFLQVFDTNGKFYYLKSKNLDTYSLDIKINYTSSEKRLQLIINGKVVDRAVLDAKLYNYSKNNICIGTNSDRSSFIKAGLKRFSISNSNESVFEYDYSKDTYSNYNLTNIHNPDMNGVLNNVYFDRFTRHLNPNSYIPFRRKSKIKRLSHESNGYKDGIWKEQVTRWNQLRFYNEDLYNENLFMDNGLSSCVYRTHSKNQKKRYIHLKVGL